MPSDDWEPDLSPEYWLHRRPYIVSNGRVWIGELGAHHDTAPSEMPIDSLGEIYENEVRPYQPEGMEHKALVEEAWRNHVEHPRG
jgi:hypothetical protein